jgi:hypothetical protein
MQDWIQQAHRDRLLADSNPVNATTVDLFYVNLIEFSTNKDIIL